MVASSMPTTPSRFTSAAVISIASSAALSAANCCISVTSPMVIEPSLSASPIMTVSGMSPSAAKAVMQLPAANSAVNNHAVIFFIILSPFL